MTRLRDSLRQHQRPKVANVEGDAYVRALTGAGRHKYMTMAEDAKDKGGVSIAAIAALGLCNADGTLEFNPDIPEDVEEVSALDGGFLERVGLKLFEVSGLSKKSRESAEGKSEASQSEDSGSGSH